MERHFGTGEVGLQRPRVSAVSDKAKLVGLLIALAVNWKLSFVLLVVVPLP